ncbi:MAG: DUF4276 family protein [Betaproteobacteria bacterium]|nr:DUF4276 family protein [Betaproteobacteria bacterium]
MSRVHLLVEGQTEETFVRELLQPHYSPQGLYLTYSLVRTSSGHKGGMTSYAKTKTQIERLCRQDANAHVSTMFDLYGLPGDFPGKNSPKWAKLKNGADKAALVEQEMASDIGQPNFIPYIQAHEFEALLFVDASRFSEWTNTRTVQALQQARAGSAPEDINDDSSTAPSKRILAAMPNYRKTFHGPLIACEIGLDALRKDCPHFDAWLHRLETLKP